MIKDTIQSFKDSLAQGQVRDACYFTVIYIHCQTKRWACDRTGSRNSQRAGWKTGDRTTDLKGQLWRVVGGNTTSYIGKFVWHRLLTTYTSPPPFSAERSFDTRARVITLSLGLTRLLVETRWCTWAERIYLYRLLSSCSAPLTRSRTGTQLRELLLHIATFSKSYKLTTPRPIVVGGLS